MLPKIGFIHLLIMQNAFCQYKRLPKGFYDWPPLVFKTYQNNGNSLIQCGALCSASSNTSYENRFCDFFLIGNEINHCLLGSFDHFDTSSSSYGEIREDQVLYGNMGKN